MENFTIRSTGLAFIANTLPSNFAFEECTAVSCRGEKNLSTH
jgi:hypothetical protein